MKKYLYNIVLATLILMSTTVVKASNEVYYTNKNNLEMTEIEYNNLLELGFTERQIEIMDEEVFLENKDIEATFIGEEAKYIKVTTYMRNGIKTKIVEQITKEEADEEILLQSQNPTRMSGSFYDGVFDSGIIEVINKMSGVGNTYMRLKTDIDWYGGIPTDRYNDIIATSFESSKVEIASSIIFREDWRYTDATYDYDVTCAPKSEISGGSAIFSLPSGSLTQLEAYIYFNVKKVANVGTITELHSCGHYAHATNYVGINDLYSHYNVGYPYGISIDSIYAGYYTHTYPACAAFYGTW